MTSNSDSSPRWLGLAPAFWYELKMLAILVAIALTLKATLVEIYVVPTGSMEDTILTGDMLIGNKFIYGMRTPTRIGILWTRIGVDVPWFRLPQFKQVETGDITIFEFPRDPYQKYVKRCIGTPGDTVRVAAGKVFVNGENFPLPPEGKFTKGTIFPPDREQQIYSFFTGNQDNIDPFVVPFKGMNIDLKDVTDWTSTITLLIQDGYDLSLGEKHFTIVDPMELTRMKGFLKYKILGLFTDKQSLQRRQQREQQEYIRKLIAKNRERNIYNPWEVRFDDADPELVLNNLKINGVPAREQSNCILRHDYYFFMGDNRDNSFDSRFWGFVPDTQVLGTPLISLVNLIKFRLRIKTVS